MSNYPHSSAIIPKHVELSPFMYNYPPLRSARRSLGHFVWLVFGSSWAKMTHNLTPKPQNRQERQGAIRSSRGAVESGSTSIRSSVDFAGLQSLLASGTAGRSLATSYCLLRYLLATRY